MLHLFILIILIFYEFYLVAEKKILSLHYFFENILVVKNILGLFFLRGAFSVMN